MTATGPGGVDAGLLLDAIGDKLSLWRHDTCGAADLAPSLAFAKWEQKRGVRATYFIHNDLRGFHLPVVQDDVKRLREMGHGIGLHYSALAQYLSEGVPPATTIGRALDILRKSGDVTMAAAHGSPQTYSTGAFEYECFDHFDPAKNVGGRARTWGVPTVNAEKLGLVEVYLDGAFTRYLSDSGATWRGWRGDPRPRPFERLPKEIDVGLAAIDDLGPDDSVCVLAHPCWWRIS